MNKNKNKLEADIISATVVKNYCLEQANKAFDELERLLDLQHDNEALHEEDMKADADQDAKDQTKADIVEHD